MIAEINIKVAQITEFENIAALAREIWDEHYIKVITQEQIDYMLQKFYSLESLTKQFEEGQLFYLVYLNQKQIGFFAVSNKDENLFLHKIYVKEFVRGTGIGYNILEYIKRNYQDAKDIRLTVNRQNVVAINFYFRNGFKIEKIADFDIGNGYEMNDFIMLKVLNLQYER